MNRSLLIGCCMAMAACTNSGKGPKQTDADRGPNAILSGEDLARFEEAVNGLPGKWESVQDSGRTVFNEQWERAGERSLKGIGYVMSGADTVFVEHLALRWDTVPVYTVRTPSQNGNDEVHFTLQEGCCSRGKLIFENMAHDWPQTITYTRTLAGWSAVVSGMDKSAEREARFEFVPKKQASASQ